MYLTVVEEGAGGRQKVFEGVWVGQDGTVPTSVRTCYGCGGRQLLPS